MCSRPSLSEISTSLSGSIPGSSTELPARCPRRAPGREAGSPTGALRHPAQPLGERPAPVRPVAPREHPRPVEAPSRCRDSHPAVDETLWVVALDVLDLTVRPGEIFGFLGRTERASRDDDPPAAAPGQGHHRAWLMDVPVEDLS